MPRGTLEAPIHVQYSESARVQVLRLLQRLAFFGLACGAVMMLIDEKGLPKGLGLGQNEVQPVVGSPKRFSDVVGVDEAKEELMDIVKYLRQPKTITRLGGKLPKGCLLTGPPGTGKTLLERAVAGEAGVPFFYHVGVGVRGGLRGRRREARAQLFGAAKKRAPCIIFIDEIDAIGSLQPQRAASDEDDAQPAPRRDGRLPAELGRDRARGDQLPRVARPRARAAGRFDTRVTVPLPDVRGRKQILDLYSKPVPLDEGVDLETIARSTPGFSGADLSNLMNVAALKASHDEKKRVGMADLEYACDKIRMGPERKSAVISPANLKLTAYHEGGHALVALNTRGAMPINTATIEPRGDALGMVSYLPEKDQMNLTRQQMLAHIDVCMGGRVAEELIFGPDEVTTGASSDLMQATSMARNMVTKYGMSESLGPMYHERSELENLSPATRAAVEAEVKAYVTRGEANARRILSQHKQELHRLAKGLLAHETLSREEIGEVIAGREVRREAKAKAEAAGGGRGNKGVVAAAKGAAAKGGAAVAATARDGAR